MTGDQADILRRLRAVLPSRWFPDDAPVLDSALSGFASTWSWLQGSVTQAGLQLRIATASDNWLNLIAVDYFGRMVRRRRRESDPHFSARVRAELLRERGTRRGLRQALLDLTGREPVIFEPAQPQDTGSYGLLAGVVGKSAYNTVGGWGNLGLPFQCFVTAYRPRRAGIAAVLGWGCPIGAYGQGVIEYANIALMEDLVSDTEILDVVTRTMPVATIAWVRIAD